MPCECSVSCFDDGQSHGYIELERLFFKFTNFFWKNEDHEVEFTGGENEIHWDYIMTYCEFREMPMIAYYSDRYNIPFFESEREHYFVL